MPIRAMFKRIFPIFAATILALPAVQPALADAPVRIGLLTCQVDGATGRILGSRRELSCIFSPATARPLERYAGEITRIGIDLGTTEYSDISWAVFSITGQPWADGVLEGIYAGVSGEVGIGYGLGANVLIGGLERSFALQPLSVQTGRGFNLALGVAQLQLISVSQFGEPSN
jgi:hypothetical protein